MLGSSTSLSPISPVGSITGGNSLEKGSVCETWESSSVAATSISNSNGSIMGIGCSGSSTCVTSLSCILYEFRVPGLGLKSYLSVGRMSHFYHLHVIFNLTGCKIFNSDTTVMCCTCLYFLKDLFMCYFIIIFVIFQTR